MAKGKNKSRDLDFLREMQERLERARNGDETEFDFLEQMIADWIEELDA